MRANIRMLPCEVNQTNTALPSSRIKKIVSRQLTWIQLVGRGPGLMISNLYQVGKEERGLMTPAIQWSSGHV